MKTTIIMIGKTNKDACLAVEKLGLDPTMLVIADCPQNFAGVYKATYIFCRGWRDRKNAMQMLDAARENIHNDRGTIFFEDDLV